MENKNHMFISTDAEKSLDKIQHPFLIKKTFSKVGIEGAHLNIVNARCEKHSSHRSQWDEL